MKRKTKIVIWTAVALFMVVVALLSYSALLEDPLYARIGGTLPERRLEADRLFGGKTWEEFRDNNGIEHRDDRAKWKEIEDSIPEIVKGHWIWADVPTSTAEDAFVNEREWFDALPERIAPLTVQHVFNDDMTAWSGKEQISVHRIGLALDIAIVGAADIGDVEAVGLFAQAAWQLASKCAAEPDIVYHDAAQSARAWTAYAISHAIVQHRYNEELLDAFEEALSTAPTSASFAEIAAGEARSFEVRLIKMRSLKPGEIPIWIYNLDHIGPDRYVPPTLMESIEALWGGSEDKPARVGKSTADAIEARFWEVAIDLWKATENSSTESDEVLTRISAQIDRAVMFDEPTYDLAKYLVRYPRSMLTNGGYYGFDDWSTVPVRSEFYLKAVQALVPMLRRYPEIKLLPDDLPEDIVFADPFGGRSILYQKTVYGFTIYSRSEDRYDNGFPNPQLRNLRANYVAYSQSGGRVDVGLLVRYP